MNNPIVEHHRLPFISDIPGYSPNISRLICMMNHARLGTIGSVKGLTVKELDYLHDHKSNSIGALLLHIAAVDFFYQKESFEERELNDEEFNIWKAAWNLGELARKEIRNNDLDYYVNILNEVRTNTYELLKQKDDEWLEKEIPYGDHKSNNYYLWFHVFEDEINHRGQINWLKKRIKV